MINDVLFFSSAFLFMGLVFFSWSIFDFWMAERRAGKLEKGLETDIGSDVKFMDMEYEETQKHKYLKMVMDRDIVVYKKDNLEGDEKSEVVNSINFLNEHHYMIIDADQRVVGDCKRIVEPDPEIKINVNLSVVDL